MMRRGVSSTILDILLAVLSSSAKHCLIFVFLLEVKLFTNVLCFSYCEELQRICRCTFELDNYIDLQTHDR